MPNRLEIITNWLSLQLSKKQHIIKLVPITNDASQRKYYRCYLKEQTYIVMDSLLDPSLPTFISIAKQFYSWGLKVPKIYSYDLVEKLALLSDLGDKLYLNNLNATTADGLYSAAMEALLMLQRQTAGSKLGLAKMEQSYLQAQLTVFQQWFLQQHLQITLNLEIQSLLQELAQLFKQIFLLQPQVIVHLDYHSRNLLLLADNTTGILDFQDAMLGPITYDLVSLWQDAYICWPRKQVITWLLQYQQLAYDNNILTKISQQDFIRWFDLVGLQRHLKNLGVFARLNYRDGKAKYLQDIPRLLAYIQATCNLYPELANLREFFEKISGL